MILFERENYLEKNSSGWSEYSRPRTAIYIQSVRFIHSTALPAYLLGFIVNRKFTIF
jgi:hypothetical protein